MHSSSKLGLLYGTSGTWGGLLMYGLSAVAANSLIAGPAILLSGLPLALSATAASVIASRKNWLSPQISVARAALASLPLTFLPIAMMIGWIGWGDIQEHWTRAIFHLIHRETTDRVVGVLIMVAVAVTSGIASGLLLWVSVSLLKKRYQGRMLFLSCAASSVLVGTFWSAAFATAANQLVALLVGLLLISVFGFLYGLAMETEANPQIVYRVFRYSSVFLLVAIIAGASTVAALSKPEKRFPRLVDRPIWIFDLASTGCQRASGDPDSSSSSTEITFARESTIAMAYNTTAPTEAGKEWAYKTCLFTIDVHSGTLVGQTSMDAPDPTRNLNQAVVNANPDGTIALRENEIVRTFSRELKEIAPERKIDRTEEISTAAHWQNFRSGKEGELWFDGGGEPRLLGQYSPGGVYIHPLGTEHVLVIGGKQFTLFRSDGTHIAEEKFTREGVHFAAVSADKKWFAVSVYLWGVGDPSYLEEERIVVFRSDTGEAISSFRSDPPPAIQSWTALSPDGSLLAIGAKNTLKLFRLADHPR